MLGMKLKRTTLVLSLFLVGIRIMEERVLQSVLNRNSLQRIFIQHLLY